MQGFVWFESQAADAQWTLVIFVAPLWVVIVQHLLNHRRFSELVRGKFAQKCFSCLLKEEVCFGLHLYHLC